MTDNIVGYAKVIIGHAWGGLRLSTVYFKTKELAEKAITYLDEQDLKVMRGEIWHR